MNPIEDTLRKDPKIRRLVDNPKWRHAAEAAILHFCDGKPCPNRRWQGSSTWAQVKMAYDRLATAASESQILLSPPEVAVSINCEDTRVSKESRVQPIFLWLKANGGDLWPALLLKMADGARDLNNC